MPVVATSLPDAAFESLSRKPASDMKREGWRGVMRTVDSVGTVLVTNHDQPQAVILSLEAYRQLAEQAQRARSDSEARLQRLSRDFDADLTLLHQTDAGDRLRAAFAAPLKLKRKVVAGREH